MNKTLFAFVLSLCLCTLAALSPGQAGITIDQIPNKGALPYVQLPDGTFKVEQADSSGSAATTPDGTQDGVTQSGTCSSPCTGASASLITFTAAQLKGMSYITFGFTSAGSGNSVTVDAAADGSTFNAGAAFYRNDSASASQPVTSNVVSISFQFVVPITAPSMRIRIVTYGSGTVTVQAIVKRGSAPQPNSFVNATTAVGLGSGANSQSVEEAGRSFTNLAANATTTVKSGKGFLHTVCINTKGASANTVTLYDNTAGSGTKIGTIDTTAASGCLTYDIAFGTGLTAVEATGTAADVTYSYR